MPLSISCLTRVVTAIIGCTGAMRSATRGVTKGLDRLPVLRTLGDDVSRTLLMVERVSHHCTLTSDALDQLQHPLRRGDQRVSALRFGDLRVQAFLQALAGFAHLPAGFRHRPAAPRRRVARPSLYRRADDV